MTRETAVVVTMLVGSALWDLKENRIPNRWLAPFGLVGLVLAGLDARLGESALGLLFVAGPPAVLYFLSDGRILGGGDVKLLAVLGLLSGAKHGLHALQGALACLLLVGVFLRLQGALGTLFHFDLRGLASRTVNQLPMAPALLLGEFIALGLWP